MKRLIFLLLITIPFLGFGQSVNLTWEDSQGREFSINSHSGKFKYSMVSGDQIYYNGRYDSGPEGSVKKIGGMSVYYNGRYDNGPEGSFKKTTGTISY